MHFTAYCTLHPAYRILRTAYRILRTTRKDSRCHTPRTPSPRTPAPSESQASPFPHSASAHGHGATPHSGATGAITPVPMRPQPFAPALMRASTSSIPPRSTGAAPPNGCSAPSPMRWMHPSCWRASLRRCRIACPSANRCPRCSTARARASVWRHWTSIRFIGRCRGCAMTP